MGNTHLQSQRKIVQLDIKTQKICTLTNAQRGIKGVRRERHFGPITAESLMLVAVRDLQQLQRTVTTCVNVIVHRK